MHTFLTINEIQGDYLKWCEAVDIKEKTVKCHPLGPGADLADPVMLHVSISYINQLQKLHRWPPS